MSKPPEILALEEVYGITLEETKEVQDIVGARKSNLYLLNRNGLVIGLNLDGNEIKEIRGLEVFNNLYILSLHNNYISELKNIEKLINLSILFISFNKISKIENLNELKNLSQLYLHHNKISKIENLDKLTNLSILNISENQISKIENLDKLINLSQLYFNRNKISKIENLDNLINLSELNISDNQITKIENLYKLRNLQHLYISYNQITKIENLNKLSKLTKLNFNNNLIGKIENLNVLNNLSELYISSNQITKIENVEIAVKLHKLKRLEIDNNPFIEQYNLILKKYENHLDIIKSELQKLQETLIKVLFPVKVMLLGNHASGKSTLLNYLQTQQCSKVDKSKNTSTHVLSVVHSTETINYELPKAIFYDFGGQDYYHGVYQAFFTQEAVNVLVWNPESDTNSLLVKDSNEYPTRNYNRMYWLAQLKYSFQKQHETLDNYDDPLLLIQTHADECVTKHNWNEAFTENRVVDEFHISLNADYKTKRNDASLAYLTATFWDVVGNLSSEEKEVSDWFPVFLKYILEEKSATAVSLDTIVKYYKRKALTLAKKRTFLQEDLEQLARKGMLLYYKNDDELNDVAWLNPSATVAYIHDKILGKDDIKEFKGRLPQSEFKKRGVSAKIERLLLNEKVLFFDEANNEYIIPNYLPLTSEDAEIYDLLKFDFNKPTFVLKFERFIPFGLINQLICHYGQNPDKKHYWRDQLIFTLNKQFKVWIQLDFSKLTISVSIKPKQAKDPKLNDCIWKIFVEINFLYWGKETYKTVYEEDLQKMTQDMQNEQILIEGFKNIYFKSTLKPDDLYLSTDGNYFVHYNTLNNPKKTQESIVSYELPEEENDLDKTNPRTQRSYKYRNFTDNENIKKMKKIFISYSREDVDYKNELRKHLNMLKRFDVADNWSCEDITIGKWHDQIQKELEESDLVIFMLSINFFNSQYILEQEVVNTMNAIANGSDKKVYSIIVSDFPGLENFDTEGLDETQKSILKLGDYQYGMYAQEKSVVTGNTKERIISLKEASNRGIIDTQLTKIVTKIMKDIK